MDMNMKDNAYPTRVRMRWKKHDYSAQGAYFITIVTNNRLNLFGKIQNGKLLNNDAGKMIKEEYARLEERCKGVGCLDSVVMPNHFHCIMYLDRDGGARLADVIRTFKSVTTHRYIQGVRNSGWHPFDKRLWQTSYWDDIIWNGRQFDFIRRYIYLNPERWTKDNINPEHDEDTDHIVQCIKSLG